MAIYFSLAGFILLYGVGYRANLTERRRRNFIIVSFGLLILVAALRSPTVGIDLAGHYAKRYDMIAACSWKDIPVFSDLIDYEIGYCYYTKLLTCISTDVQFYMIVTAIISYGITGYFIFKKSTDVVMSTELFICMCVYYMYMTMLRQQLAVDIVLIAYLILSSSKRRLKDYVVFCFFIILAATFHTSAILCLLMILFDRIYFTRKQIVIALVATVIGYVFYARIYSLILQMLGSGNNYERYVLSATEGVGHINKQSIASLLLTAGAILLGFYVFIWRKRRYGVSNVAENLKKEESFMLYMGLLASICRLLIFQMNIISRFTYYFIPFVIVLYPNAIDAFSNKTNRKTLRGLVYMAFGIYFVWMTVVYVEKFYGAVPYRFFWE